MQEIKAGDIQSIVIVGGTHGNELTGTSLLTRWQTGLCENKSQVNRSSFSTDLFLANIQANEKNIRYVDADLNRQFSQQSLNDISIGHIEGNRAKVIDHHLGPKQAPKTDLIIDLHTTTANMGVTLVINTNNAFHIKMAAYVQQQMPEATIFFEPKERLDDNFLMSVAKFSGFLVEVGPIAQGVVNPHIFEQTRQATEHALDFVEKFNQQQPLDLPKSVEAFQFVRKVKMPEDESGKLMGMVHPKRQSQDYQPVEKGDPLFMDFQGNDIVYDGSDGQTVYPAFINEAAYYDQHHGLSIMQKITLKI